MLSDLQNQKRLHWITERCLRFFPEFGNVQASDRYLDPAMCMALCWMKLVVPRELLTMIHNLVFLLCECRDLSYIVAAWSWPCKSWLV